MTAPEAPVSRRITHAELVYRPGERALAARVFELLGCRVKDRGNHWFTAFVDPAVEDYTTNTLYASEVTPEQWAFEQELAGRLSGDLGDKAAAWTAHVRGNPQYSFHFGIRLATRDILERTLADIEEAGKNDPELAGRVSVSGVYRPEGPDAATDTMMQVFVHTDVIASGLLTFGQHVELQWHVPS
ncbi:hypothetical protein [Yinghuangia seranimata]|uniref:hypothetical protein n=1 Tax=Yinghuangia seranimata TaxID=408067 RepID=UPI00248ABE24|nr:hypothetical protein [Yinghuangia seranimata]MDI2129410.1 hypothetical protein [Yinghuangia seranimata]